MPSFPFAEKRSAVADSLLAVIPSSRVSMLDYVQHLHRNGVSGYVLGRGTARVVGVDGRRRRVAGAVVVVGGVDAEKAQKIARLCGITAVLLDRSL